MLVEKIFNLKVDPLNVPPICPPEDFVYYGNPSEDLLPKEFADKYIKIPKKIPNYFSNELFALDFFDKSPQPIVPNNSSFDNNNRVNGENDHNDDTTSDSNNNINSNLNHSSTTNNTIDFDNFFGNY